MAPLDTMAHVDGGVDTREEAIVANVWPFGSSPVSHGRLRPLLVPDLASLPACTSSPSCPLRRLMRDLGWAEAAVAEWGMCGVGLFTDGQTDGYALVSPALHIPRTHPLSRGANADAAALIAVRLPETVVDRQLIQGLAARLVDQRNITAIDAVPSDAGTCDRPPYEWLETCGFIDLNDGVRMRLDLSATRIWPSMTSMLRQVVSAVRPATSPKPVSQPRAYQETAERP